eukprot:scaffold17139_cov123-Isochrysis_galbana.AAC.3
MLRPYITQYDSRSWRDHSFRLASLFIAGMPPVSPLQNVDLDRWPLPLPTSYSLFLMIAHCSAASASSHCRKPEARRGAKAAGREGLAMSNRHDHRHDP